MDLNLLRNLMDNEEFNDMMSQDIVNSEYLFQSIEEEIVELENMGYDIEPRDIAAVGKRLADAYFEEFYTGPYAEIPEQEFKIYFAWSISKEIQKAMIKKDAYKAGSYAEDEVDEYKNNAFSKAYDETIRNNPVNKD